VAELIPVQRITVRPLRRDLIVFPSWLFVGRPTLRSFMLLWFQRGDNTMHKMLPFLTEFNIDLQKW